MHSFCTQIWMETSDLIRFSQYLSFVCLKYISFQKQFTHASNRSPSSLDLSHVNGSYMSSNLEIGSDPIRKNGTVQVRKIFDNQLAFSHGFDGCFR